MDQEEVARRYRAWKELMDFGWEYCLQIFPQLRPGTDPLERLREAFERKAKEHLAANERMAAAIGRADGR